MLKMILILESLEITDTSLDKEYREHFFLLVYAFMIKDNSRTINNTGSNEQSRICEYHIIRI